MRSQSAPCAGRMCNKNVLTRRLESTGNMTEHDSMVACYSTPFPTLLAGRLPLPRCAPKTKPPPRSNARHSTVWEATANPPAVDTPPPLQLPLRETLSRPRTQRTRRTQGRARARAPAWIAARPCDGSDARAGVARATAAAQTSTAAPPALCGSRRGAANWPVSRWPRAPGDDAEMQARARLRALYFYNGPYTMYRNGARWSLSRHGRGAGKPADNKRLTRRLELAQGWTGAGRAPAG
jgi:hypothetical protein